MRSAVCAAPGGDVAGTPGPYLVSSGPGPARLAWTDWPVGLAWLGMYDGPAVPGSLTPVCVGWYATPSSLGE
jgi:hypothetical protein